MAKLLEVHQKDYYGDGNKKGFVALEKLLHSAVVVARRVGDEVILLAVLGVGTAYLWRGT